MRFQIGSVRKRLALVAVAYFLAGLGVCGCQKSGPVTAAPGPASLALDTEQREYLWQVEHHGLLLGKHGFQTIKDGLIKNDARILASVLAPGFKGEVLAKPVAIRAETRILHVLRAQDSGEAGQSLDGSDFIERLLQYRRPFQGPPKIQMSLMMLSPGEYGNLASAVWHGSCLVRLWGETQPGHPAETVLQVKFEIPQPTQENLSRPGWLLKAAITQSQVAKAEHYLFRETAQARGLSPGRFHDNWKVADEQSQPNTGGVYLTDFNRDGILDMLVTDVTGYAFYQGLPGGGFKDVTQSLHLPTRLQSPYAVGLLAAFVDLDGDGWEDLILGNTIHRNVDGKRFEDHTFASNLILPTDAVGIAIADYDRDGLLDLYVTRGGKPRASSWLDGQSGDPQGNQLWRNKGNWHFENVTQATGTAGGNRSTFSAVWLDADNNGWPDLHVINEFGDGILLVNLGNGVFREQPLCAGPCDFGTMGVTCGDIDNDGHIDLFMANMYSKAGSRVIGNLRPGTYPDEIMAKFRQFVAGNQLHRNLGNLKFEQRGKDYQIAGVGWSYGAALVDIDNDGWLDLYATCGFLSHSRAEPDG